MDVVELKFLLKLLEFPQFRAPLTQIKLAGVKAAERGRVCARLCDRNFIDRASEIASVQIAPPGRALLNFDASRLPIGEAELTLLREAQTTIALSKTSLPADRRQAIAQSSIEKGLLTAEKTQVKEVWLTDRGREYLLHEWEPDGGTTTIEVQLLGNYVRFLRQFSPRSETTSTAAAPASNVDTSDAEILQLIAALDRELATDNYLPIFYLRQKLQPSLSRAELDSALYRLQRQDAIELSSLQEAIAYTPEQIDAGIPQDVGGPLFFIICT